MIIVASIILLIGMSFLGFVSAQTREPGVSIGDSFKYSFEFNVDVSDSSFVPPSLFEDLMEEVKNIDSVQATVTQISGSVVTMQTVIQFENGTQQSETTTFDVANGEDSTQEANIGMFLIAANLNAGDNIYASGKGGAINETVTRSYPSGSREVNHQSIVLNYDVGLDELDGTGITEGLQQSNMQDTYWDKQTGALVEMTFNMVTRSSVINADIDLNVQLVDSSVFVVPEFPASSILVVLALGVSTLVVVFRYKKGNAMSSRFSFKPQ